MFSQMIVYVIIMCKFIFWFYTGWEMAPYIESIDSQEESYFVVWHWLHYITLVETCVAPFLVLTQTHKNQVSIAWLPEAHSFFLTLCKPFWLHNHNFHSNLISVLEILFLCSNNIWIIHYRLLKFSLRLWKYIIINKDSLVNIRAALVSIFFSYFRSGVCAIYCVLDGRQHAVGQSSGHY